ncbi:MAG TPA: DUF835 domain-containing protein [Thermoplasmata archaeon]|nr:DUF835 domain-containing protein [Thermoplasmata archaeon]
MLRSIGPFDARSIEESTRRYWSSRSLPAPSGGLGPPSGGRTHQLFGTVTSEETFLALVHRAVLADADARYLAQAGRRTSGRILVRAHGPSGEVESAAEVLRRLGVWLGGGQPEKLAPDPHVDRIQAMVDRLAAANLLVSREAPIRSCPVCRTPRTPAGIVYEEARAPAYLVRFPLRETTPRVSLLVWVDSLWKLLGTTALVVNPTLSYVTARFRRHGEEELILLSRSAMARLAEWIPGAELEVLSESPGASLEGRRYDHPLSHEAPGLGAIEGAAGAIHASAEVTDSGTGIVTLVPSHGAGDAAVGIALGVAGWPVLDSDLTLSTGFSHKYQGLAIDAGEAFIQRDVSDSGYLFAQLTVRRGVPHCAVCGEGLVWETGRTWCLEPGRLSADRLDLLGRLLPQESLPPAEETVPWPVTERDTTEDDSAPLLLDCPSCGRLSPASARAACPCGGTRQPVRRHLLPVFLETLVAWARETPFPAGEALRLYVADRRRIPAVIHHLVAMEGADAHPGEVRLAIFPTLPTGNPRGFEIGADEPVDAVRATLVGLRGAPRAGLVSLADRRVAEDRRLRKLWATVQDAILAMSRDGYSIGATPIGARLSELREEDRAFLSTFERMRLEVLREYELGHLAIVQARLARFLEDDLRDGFLPLIRRRLDSAGLPPEKSAAYAVLAHVLPLWAELYAPIAPFTCEAIGRLFRGEGESLFERPFTPILQTVLDPNAERAYRRWRSVSQSLVRARRHLRLPAATPLERVVLFVREEEAADELRAASEILARITNVQSLEVASPNLPWEGKRVQAVPVLSAIQKVFATGTPRVVRLLSGLPGRRVQEGIRSHSLQVAVEGRPVEIISSMVEFVETLPEGVVPIPWELGELYIQVPLGARAGGEGDAPPLTPDGFRLLRRVRRRLRTALAIQSIPGIVVFAQGRLAEEVDRQQTALTRYLGVPRLKIVASSEGFPRDEVVVGRSGRGDRWSVWVPGVKVVATRRKERAALPESRVPRRLGDERASVDLLAGPAVERENQLQDWVNRLDIQLGRPIMGVSKLRYAWEMGIHSYDDLVHAPFEQLSQIPGFGPIVAAEIVRTSGGVVPTLRVARPEFRYASLPRPAVPDLVVPSPAAPESTAAAPPSALLRVPSAEPEEVLPAIPTPVPPSLGPAPPTPEVPSSASLGEATPSTTEVVPPVESDSEISMSPLAPELATAETPVAEEPVSGDSTPVSTESLTPSELPIEPLAEPPPANSAPPPEPGPVADAGAPPVLEESGPSASPEVPQPDNEPLRGDSAPPEPVFRAEEPLVGSVDLEPQPSPSAGAVARESAPPPAEAFPLPGANEPSEPSGTVGSPEPTTEDIQSVAAAMVTSGAPEVGASAPSQPEPSPVEPALDVAGSTSPSDSISPDGAGLADLAASSIGERAKSGVAPTSPEPVAPAAIVPPPPPEPRRTGTFISSETVSGPTWATFLDATAAGHRGLCLSREFPDRLRALIGPRDVTIIWLSNAGRPGSARPGDLDALGALVEKMVTQEGVTAVYIDSVEFLIRVNSLDRVLELLQRLHQQALAHNARVWVPVNPLLASSADAEKLVTAFAD